jgi:hypothetical protein
MACFRLKFDRVSTQPEGLAETGLSGGIFVFPGTLPRDQLKQLRAATKRRIGKFVPFAAIFNSNFWISKKCSH